MFGHGWLNLTEKTGLINQYKSLGLSHAAMSAHIIGVFEIVSAAILLIFPYRPFILAIFIWKMSSELFYPRYELFEWVERGGSYASIISLWYCLEWRTFPLLKKTFAS
jgi:hypothetical protein